MKKFSLGALVAAGLLVGGLSAGSASAADLGGNCCADLEERIAELEATTARKGNRKVSLTISGWVGEQVMYWDDGVEQNAYVTGLGATLSSHFKFTGQATITPGWSAGYVIHVEAIDSDALTIDQFSQHNTNGLAGDGAFGINLLQSFWFIKSDNLGKLGVGLQSSASDNAAILVDGSGSLVPANWVMFDYNSFQLRDNNGDLSGLIWGQAGGFCRNGGGAGGDCFGAPRDSVRYDTPTWGGFSASASWGEDDFWDAAVRYAGEWNGIKVAAAAAYSEWTCDFAGSKSPLNGGIQGAFNSTEAGCGDGVPMVGAFANVLGDKDSQYFQAGVYVEHVPTGLWGYLAYGHLETDAAILNAVTANTYNEIPDGETWYGKLGLRERWSPLGHTVLYGEYGRWDDSVNDLFVANNVSAETELWGLGFVQEIDAAAMSIWVSYRHLEADIDGTAARCGAVLGTVGANSCSTDDFQYIKAGALINF